MNATDLGLEPLIGVEELAEYLGVPVRTIYDWRLSGRAPRAYKFGKHLRCAASDIAAWLEERHEGGSLEEATHPHWRVWRDHVHPAGKGQR
ncbi:hypothetical protein GCM10027599_20400 [Yimella radicis]